MKVFISLTILYVGGCIAINILKNVDYFWSFPEITQIVLSIIIQTWIFRNLYLNMKRNHLYEFLIQKDSMKLQYCASIACAVYILFSKLYYGIIVNFKESKTWHRCTFVKDTIASERAFITNQRISFIICYEVL